MGLFDLFSRQERGRDEKREEETLLDYSGIRVEVLTQEGELLFAARLAVSRGGVAELQQISREAVELNEGDTLPVRLRGYEEKQALAVHMECAISLLSARTWRADRLKIVGKDNDRAFYRQSTDTSGEVGRIGRARSGTAPCKVLNISAGGACIRTKQKYQSGDRLLLKSRLIPESEASSLLCQVCRVTERPGGNFEYGCRFINLDKGMEDQLAKTIMDLQLKKRKR